MQYGFTAHAVKHEPIALQILEQTLELGLQLRFTHLVTIKTKICTVDCLPDIITCTQFQVEIFSGYDRKWEI